jgi:hypothetical protein
MTEREAQVDSEAIELLFQTYRILAKIVPPDINTLHDSFKHAFYTEMLDFLHANNELNDDKHLGDMDAFLLSHELPVPSEIQMHAALHHFGISYVSRNHQLINGSVIPVW